MSKPIVIPATAQHEMMALTSKRNLTVNALSTLNLSGLQKRLKCCSVYPIVEANLVRNQDRRNKKRVDLAQDISEALSLALRQDFGGNAADSELVLWVRVAVVSDGSRKCKRISDYRGTGEAKLAFSYCLFSRESGEIILSKLIGDSATARNSDGVPELLKLYDAMRGKLCCEVKFICCSRLDGWSDIAETLVSEDSEKLSPP